MDQTNTEQANSRVLGEVASDHDLRSFCLDLADLFRQEKISRWSMNQRVEERFPHLGQEVLQLSINSALKFTLEDAV